jgi:putative ABC transport system substrate-binding protein
MKRTSLPLLRRRDFIAGLGSAVAWPLAARAQQPAMPVIGFLGTQSAEAEYKDVTVPFFQGLKETGYVNAQQMDLICWIILSHCLRPTSPR